MLEIIVDSVELFNDQTQEFITTPRTVLQLEHSLISVSKWESKWHKSFLKSSNNLTSEEILDYIKCMTISPGKVDDSVYYTLSKSNIDSIIAYIQDPRTATWINKPDVDTKRGPKEVITSELIYYWMVALNIPFECQKWHLNRLMTLIEVCNAKNENPRNPKRMSERSLMSRNAALNAQRRAQLKSKG